MAKAKDADYNHLCCFVMFILAHGNKTSFTTDDNVRYKMSTIKDKIQSIPGLVGKPKLLFLQTCRGDKFDEGVDVEAASSDGDEKIPSGCRGRQ
uniref:Caspase family p20 domain-containing protein n=1 Tax=Amphimedon queenslandica TaxID=400682 RepID=A0A1X7UKU3_AMPQE